MATPSYSNIVDPEMIMRVVGEQWLNAANVVNSGIAMRDARPMQGSRFSEIRQKIFQGTSGQALGANDTISTQAKQQVQAYAPNLWRYNGVDMPDVLEEIMEKEAEMINVDLAAAIQEAATQYVDDSAISVIEGVAGALTDNQLDYSGTGDIALAAIAQVKAKALDKIRSLDSGAIIMHSKVYYDALELGMLAATANTFGIQLQEGMVRDGVLPNTILGLTPIVTDKLAKDGADYRSFLVGRNALTLRGNSSPIVEEQRKEGSFATKVLFKVGFALGVPGTTFGGSASEKVTDAALATSGNWTLSTNTNSNDVAIYRLQTT